MRLLSGKVRRLLREWPTERGKGEKLLEAGNLQGAAAAWAGSAADQGAEGEWWRAWLAIQEARGIGIEDAIRELKAEQRRWFGVWGLGNGREEEGAAAYRRYLERPGSRRMAGPFAW